MAIHFIPHYKLKTTFYIAQFSSDTGNPSSLKIDENPTIIDGLFKRKQLELEPWKPPEKVIYRIQQQ